MGKQWQTLFWGVRNHCRWWLQPWNKKTLTPWKKSYDQPSWHIKKQRHYFANKGLSSQGYGFSSSHVCESWAIKKAECWRIDAFELWCWTRLLTVPGTARRSVLNVHWKDLCWSWNSNTLDTWCEELTHLKRPWCWERLKAREGDDRGWDGWMASPTQWTWIWASSRSWWWTGKPGMLQSMESQRVWHNWMTKLNWRPSRSNRVS